MTYLPQLTEEEVRYICSVIPYNNIIMYFRKNPKQLAKIRPGFRAEAISDIEASKLLFNNRNRDFISSFIENHISNWLSSINEYIDKCIEENDNKDMAYMYTLPFSYFANNIALYFKLIGEKRSEEYITLLTVAVKSIKDEFDKRNGLQKELENKKSSIKELQTELEKAKSELERTSEKFNKCLAEMKELEIVASDVEQLRVKEQNYIQVIASLEKDIRKKEETVSELRKELSDLKSNFQQIETRIRTEFEKQQAAAKLQVTPKPRRPSDMGEFKDFLGYNLTDIGIPEDSEYYTLLKEHLSKTLFQGTPVVVNRCVGTNLMKCLANTIIKQPTVETITYRKDISISEIDYFLSSVSRIACLDNFIGNCNESELLPLFDLHRDKIIFLTIAYERTLQYVSPEFLRYCQYLNLNRIAVLSFKIEITEDPSTIEEIDFDPQWVAPINRYSSLLSEIINELGFPQSLIEKKCSTIFDEKDLCGILAFDILPFCVDVLQLEPFNVSERLVKYIEKCPYKTLLTGWFAR